MNDYFYRKNCNLEMHRGLYYCLKPEQALKKLIH